MERRLHEVKMFLDDLTYLCLKLLKERYQAKSYAEALRRLFEEMGLMDIARKIMYRIEEKGV